MRAWSNADTRVVIHGSRFQPVLFITDAFDHQDKGNGTLHRVKSWRVIESRRKKTTVSPASSSSLAWDET